MVKKILRGLEADELKSLSQLFFDIAKGILGAPLVVYFVSGFSGVVLFAVFMVSLVLAIGSAILAIYLLRLSKKKGTYG